MSLENQWKSKERAIKLLFKHTAEVDVIEKDTLQGWPKVSAHSFAGDKLTAEQWVETAVCMFFFSCTTSVTLHPLFKHAHYQNMSSSLTPGMLQSYAGLSASMHCRR